ncbi:MAG: histidine kinase dimerization/phosphoacceptor domain -containing protein [Parvibaculum sedimenti]|uniref:sensor histidine kinase n=1 Tax=Parvibaculum sedimenti TaxID=2608632 RepID=UPI003BB5A776
MAVDFGDVFNALPDACLLLSADGRFTVMAASDRQLALMRAARADVIGKPFIELLPADANVELAAAFRKVRRSLERALATGEAETLTAGKYEIVLPEEEGGGIDERYWNPRIQPVFGGDGRMACIVLKLRDVTEPIRRERELALERALAEREKMLVQKDILFREVSHRIKNSLQLVVSILNLQATAANDERIRSHLESAASRVAAITSVHERFFRTESHTAVEMSSYLRELCADIASSANNGSARWNFDVEAEALELPVDIAVPLALIVNELIINVLKHAYPGGAGPIRIALRAAEGELKLSIEDEGEVVFDRSRTGLGSRLVNALAQQIRGEIERTELAPGYRVELRLPLSS